jgi:hypothetical protein
LVGVDVGVSLGRLGLGLGVRGLVGRVGVRVGAFRVGLGPLAGRRGLRGFGFRLRFGFGRCLVLLGLLGLPVRCGGLPAGLRPADVPALVAGRSTTRGPDCR